MYASPSWFGYISVEQLIRKLFVKAHRWGLTKNADELFAVIISSCLKVWVIVITVLIICYHQ